MEYNFDKYCPVDRRSPTTVLPVANRKSSEKPKFGKDIACLNQDFPENNFSHHRSASCRNLRSESVKNEGNVVLKRGSVYRNSEEARLLKKTDAFVARKKIELSRGNVSTFLFGIIDSLCSSDEDSMIAEQNRPSVNKVESCSWDSMISSLSVASPKHETNSPQAKDMAVNLHKSLSTKSSLPHAPAKSESDGSRAACSKSRFSPDKKMFDPFVKSKSRRSPLSNSNKSIHKLMVNDLLGRSRRVDYNYHCEEKENYNSALQSSPAHLHGLLKVGNKRGVPFFEFSVKSPEDFYVAKTRKVENDLTCVYTFHSLHKRRSNRESLSLVGQMHVSCHLCTEVKGAGELNDSMVTEFVLYDIIHSRKSTSDRMLSWGNCEQNEISAKKMIKDHLNRSCDNVHFKSSVFQPLTAAELHPELEIAAVVMQVPFEKKIDKKIPDLQDLCQLGKAEEGVSDNSSLVKMHVVVPAGNHSLPIIAENGGPSRLLDRWRLGGGCDCGGWDMACPLDVFSNPNVRIADLFDNQYPAELFHQGKRDNIPAFAIRVIGDGKYAVDFHARLSSLQAFSMCVAILHAAEPSGRKRLYAKEIIESTKDAIAAAEEEIFNVNKTEQDLPSFVLNPPFSPIARV